MVGFSRFFRRFVKQIIYGDPLKAHLKRGLKVGKNFCLLEEVILDFSHTFHIEIGDDVTLAPRVHILAHDASTKKYLGYTRLGKVKIGNCVFVGAGSIILPGVTIGNNVIIGAGSIVSSDVPDGQLVAGNPARKISSTEEYMARKKLEMNSSPRFEKEYTMACNVTPEMKNEMNSKMKNRIGYIV